MDVKLFVLRSEERVKKFQKYLQKQQNNISFNSKIEENISLSFLGIKINRDIKYLLSQLNKTICRVTYGSFFTRS